MHILITGGHGFRGSNFIRYILKNTQHQVTNLDNMTYAGRGNNIQHMGLDKDFRYSFVKGDICDPVITHRVVKQVDAIVNFAAESHVDRSIPYKELFTRTNVDGLENLLEKAKLFRTKRFLHISTDEVYGSISRGEAGEDYPLFALKGENHYAKTKAQADELARMYFRRYKTPVIVARNCNNLGPYQFPEKLISLSITNLIEGKNIPLMGKGWNMREWIWSDDDCRATLFVLEHGKDGEAYNIGTGNRKRNISVARKILSAFGMDKKRIEVIEHRYVHDFRYALNSKKLKELGFDTDSFKHFDDALLETIRWYQENEKWWRPLKK